MKSRRTDVGEASVKQPCWTLLNYGVSRHCYTILRFLRSAGDLGGIDKMTARAQPSRACGGIREKDDIETEG